MVCSSRPDGELAAVPCVFRAFFLFSSCDDKQFWIIKVVGASWGVTFCVLVRSAVLCA